MADPTVTDPDKYSVVFENTGTTPTHVIFVELKGEAVSTGRLALGPSE